MFDQSFQYMSHEVDIFSPTPRSSSPRTTPRCGQDLPLRPQNGGGFRGRPGPGQGDPERQRSEGAGPLPCQYPARAAGAGEGRVGARGSRRYRPRRPEGFAVKLVYCQRTVRLANRMRAAPFESASATGAVVASARTTLIPRRSPTASLRGGKGYSGLGTPRNSHSGPQPSFTS